jgi:diguanylate cyclase (GGDEF)-like protein/PAS domain S-box-containing protein
MTPGYEEWFRLAPCGLMATSVEGVITDINDTLAHWLGHERGEVIGKTFSALLDPGSRLFYETRYMQLLHLQGAVDEVAFRMLAADGTRVPVLVNSVLDADDGAVRSALFNATERMQYEAELLQARKAAESSEARVRILQDVSSAFGLSASDEDVADSFVAVAREAFAASDAAVFLKNDTGTLDLVAGVNPLDGVVKPIQALRRTPVVIVVTPERVEAEYPELAAGMRAMRLASLSITPLLDDDEPLGILVCFFTRRVDFDDTFFDLQRALGRQASQTLVRVRLQRRLAHLALYDQLTGVANRQLLQQSLDDAIEHSMASGEPLAVVFLDVDEFKSINDQLGHAAGDEVLTQIAERLRTGVRAGDVVGRIGGDEFVAICAAADAEAAASIAERIRVETRAPMLVRGVSLAVSVSIGVSTFDPEYDGRASGDQLLIRADGAMYRSKGSGKDRVTVDAGVGEPHPS